MKIEFPLLSCLSCLLLLFFALQGDMPELYGWEVGIQATSEGISVSIDPAFLIWTYLPENGMTFGNVILAHAPLRENGYRNLLLAHEFTHVKQFQSLGVWIYLVSPFLNIEGGDHELGGWIGLQECTTTTWEPPDEWPALWHFLTLSF